MRMRRSPLVFIAISALAFAISLAANVLNTAALREARGGDGRGYSEETAKRTVFHFGALIPASARDPYFKAVRTGMWNAAASGRAAVQFFEYEPGASTTRGETLKLLRLIAELELDGLVVSIPDYPELVAALNAVAQSGVPVVTLENDLPESRRRAFVGSNDFQTGVECGGLAARMPRPGSKAALVFSSRYAEAKTRRASFLMGFAAALRQNNRLELAYTVSSRADALSGEETIRDILEDHPEIDIIVFTSARDSAEGAQTLIDFSRVGDPLLIGFDDTPEILEFIRNEVIAAAVARDPERTGAESVDALLSIRATGQSNAFVDTGLRIVDRAAALAAVEVSARAEAQAKARR